MIVALPEYADLSEELARAGLVHTPAELHGMLCGLLIKQANTPAERLLQLVAGETAQRPVLDSTTEALLDALLETTREQLQDPNLGLELLLPDDDTPLQSRFDAACDWARGLVYGLAAQGIDNPARLSADAADFYRDCLSLARGDFDTESAAEENEELYMELQEFLRIGTLLTQEEIQPLKAPPQLH